MTSLPTQLEYTLAIICFLSFFKCRALTYIILLLFVIVTAAVQFLQRNLRYDRNRRIVIRMMYKMIYRIYWHFQYNVDAAFRCKIQQNLSAWFIKHDLKCVKNYAYSTLIKHNFLNLTSLISSMHPSVELPVISWTQWPTLSASSWLFKAVMRYRLIVLDSQNGL